MSRLATGDLKSLCEMMDFLHNADIGMLMAFNGHHTAWLDSAMMFVSDLKSLQRV